ncbi:hypothetical protein GOB81_01455 [Acetobacter sp. LMG 1627]|uniref:Glycosyl transferase family 2 n=2 Tax=Acetobacter conturbans TaxID=1737472 RepID=A0ABX0JZ60_9PROT|nr:glycosyltransferase family 2 protein [Acetobacter conturbans]NHN87305.1 hypothetical protein [Acetobacter conturbans]
MARVKCVMMQRDETLLLEPWLRHYGYLFGFENLVVLDNGSIEPSVLATLEQYEQAGVRIFRGLGRPTDLEQRRASDFEAKGEYARQIITFWDATSDYDFAIPVDCDEFLAVYTDNGFSCSRADIHAALNELRDEQRPMQLRFNPGNVPGVPGCFMPMDFPKRFVAKGTVGDVDLGYHAITSRMAEGVIETRLAYLHMHHKPFPMLLKHAERKLGDRVNVADRAALRNYDGPGHHLVDYFFMTEADYHARFAADGVYFRFPGVLNHFRALGVRNNFFGTETVAQPDEPHDLVELVQVKNGRVEQSRPFEAAAYLALYPDVTASGMKAFYHYLAFGMGEGRRLD